MWITGVASSADEKNGVSADLTPMKKNEADVIKKLIFCVEVIFKLNINRSTMKKE